MSLLPQQLRGWCARCDSAREDGNEVGKQERTEDNEHQRKRGHTGLGYEVNVPGEQDPELAAQDDAERDSDNSSDDHRDR